VECRAGSQGAVSATVLLDAVVLLVGVALCCRLAHLAAFPAGVPSAQRRPYRVGAAHMRVACVLHVVSCALSYTVLASPADAWGWWWPLCVAALTAALSCSSMILFESRAAAARELASRQQDLAELERADILAAMHVCQDPTRDGCYDGWWLLLLLLLASDGAVGFRSAAAGSSHAPQARGCAADRRWAPHHAAALAQTVLAARVGALVDERFRR
jgi:hypothetical protein